MKIRRLTSDALIVLLASTFAFLACSAPRIHGTVLDPFGKGIEGVSVKIETSAFEATTDANGEYAIDYAPGALHLRFFKNGYTTRTLDLSLNQKSDFPAEKILMYPIPGERGMFYISSDSLVPLAVADVRRSDQKGTWSSVHRYYAGGEAGLSVESGEAVFIDTEPKPIHLCKLGPNRLIYDVTYQMMLAKPTFDCFREDETQQVGEEQLTVRKVKLDSGSWAWVEIDQGPVIGSRGPGRTCYPFMVP